MIEYKYRMLNPALFSTQSIQFKLSETNLESGVLMSPTKPKDSLTYTVSMETIQDQDQSKLFSPFRIKLAYDQEIQCQNLVQTQNKQEFTPVVNYPNQISILNVKQAECDVIKNQKNILIPQTKELDLQMNNQNQNQCKNSPFLKKNVLKMNNMSLQFNEDNKSIRMGKVLSRIHSHLKQYNTLASSRPKSARKQIRSLYECVSNQKIKKNIDQHKKHNQIICQDVQLLNLNKFLKLKNDKINQNTNLQTQISSSNPSEILKHSILNNTNCSSSVNCSPQLSRRKSDLIQQKRNLKYKNQIFLNNKPVQTNPRQKIYSALLPSKNFQKEFIQINQKQLQKSINYNKKSKFQGSKKIGQEKLKGKQNNKLGPIQIVALKLSITDRMGQNSAIRARSISQKTEKYDPKQTKKQKKVAFISGKQEFAFQNIKINTDFIFNKIQNKKQFRRKSKESLGKKIFFV